MSLVTIPTDDRPDWVSVEMWPKLKETMVLAKAGVDKRSGNQIAEDFGIDRGKFNNLYMQKRWRLQLEEAREDLAQSSLVAGYRLSSALHRKLDDPEAVKKLGIKDLTIALKSTNDNTLNLSNGVVGSPAFNLAFGDIKVLLGAAPAKPE